MKKLNLIERRSTNSFLCEDEDGFGYFAVSCTDGTVKRGYISLEVQRIDTGSISTVIVDANGTVIPPNMEAIHGI